MNKALKEKTIAKQQLSELHAFNDKKTEEHKRDRRREGVQKAKYYAPKYFPKFGGPIFGSVSPVYQDNYDYIFRPTLRRKIWLKLRSKFSELMAGVRSKLRSAEKSIR